GWRNIGDVFTSKANLEIVGLGGAAGYSGARGSGASILKVPSGKWGFTYNAPGGVRGAEQFQPPILRNLHVKGVAGALGGLRLARASGYIVDNCTISDFSSGVGIYDWGF